MFVTHFQEIYTKMTFGLLLIISHFNSARKFFLYGHIKSTKYVSETDVASICNLQKPRNTFLFSGTKC